MNEAWGIKFFRFCNRQLNERAIETIASRSNGLPEKHVVNTSNPFYLYSEVPFLRADVSVTKRKKYKTTRSVSIITDNAVISFPRRYTKLMFHHLIFFHLNNS